MRLINPGTGEVSDRLTILALKILAGQDAGLDIAHFTAERAALLTKIRAKPSLNGVWFEHVLELAAVNATLWQAEDTLRAAREPHGDLTHAEVAQLAYRIQELNDRRGMLVELINKDAGDGEHKEKL